MGKICTAYCNIQTLHILLTQFSSFVVYDSENKQQLICTGSIEGLAGSQCLYCEVGTECLNNI
jgi:hypothetical protein